jgi:hypothetical protein
MARRAFFACTLGLVAAASGCVVYRDPPPRRVVVYRETPRTTVTTYESYPPSETVISDEIGRAHV